jgi:hypothetical protein
MDKAGSGRSSLALTPCMHCPPCRLYLQLQRLYRAQADRDVAAVEAHVRDTLSSIGRPADSVSRESIKHFCKNARNLRVIRWACRRQIDLVLSA